MEKYYKRQPFYRRLLFAIRGILRALKNESSLQIQSVCVLLLIVFCATVKPSAIWCALFILASTVVLSLELVNTSVESILDKLHPERHPDIGFAKDCLAGAVLISSIGAVLVFAAFIFSRYAV